MTTEYCREEIKKMYGFPMNRDTIRRICPYSRTKVTKEQLYSTEYIVSFNEYLAYKYKVEGFEFIVWGGIYNGEFVFIIKSKKKKCEVPF